MGFIYTVFTDLLHINPVSIRPNVVGVVLNSLPQRTGNLVKPDEFSNLLHLRVVAGSGGVQSRYDGGHITKYGSVKKSWKGKCGLMS